MMNRFCIENYKCLANFELSLTPIHLLIGQNDAGKTSLLEAIYALFRSADVPLSDAFEGDWTGRDLIRKTANEPKMKLTAAWNMTGECQKRWGQTIEYGLGLKFVRSGRQCIAENEWVRLGGEAPIEKKRDQNATVLQQNDSFTNADQELTNQLKSLLGGAQFYHFEPRQLALPATISTDRKFRMDRDGFGLSTCIDDIGDYDPNRFLQLREAFCRYFPDFKAVRLEVEEAHSRQVSAAGVQHQTKGQGKGIRLTLRNGQDIRASQASDGALLFLGFLALMFLPKPPRLLLIEEPENGVYPHRLQQVVRMLKDLVSSHENSPQIVMTTHSPYLLSEFQPDEVTYLSKQPDGSVRARPLREAPDIHERMKGFYLGELWYNLDEKELFGD